MFQAFQLTTPVICGLATRGKKFIFSLDCVAIKEEEEVRGVLLCVQVFWEWEFRQRNFYSESGSTILSESVAITDSISSSPVYAPWSTVETACAGQVITDLRACWDRVVLRHRTAKDTSERWYQGGIPRSETASRRGVRISDVVEEGRVDYVPVASPALGPPGPGENRSPLSKQKR